MDSELSQQRHLMIDLKPLQTIHQVFLLVLLQMRPVVDYLTSLQRSLNSQPM